MRWTHPVTSFPASDTGTPGPCVRELSQHKGTRWHWHAQLVRAKTRGKARGRPRHGKAGHMNAAALTGTLEKTKVWRTKES